MQRFGIYGQLILVTFFFFFFKLTASGEDNETNSKNSTQLEPIVVVGTRSVSKLKEVPHTVNVISEDDVETVKYRNAGDLLGRVPGIFTQNLNGEEELTSIRVPTHFTNSYSLLLIDGLPASSYGDSAGGMLREINSSSIERIEVIKGPASALYGSNAIGGAINVVTKSPSSTPSCRPWGEYGEFGQWRGGISGGGAVGPVDLQADAMFIEADEWREHAAHSKQAATIRTQYIPNYRSLLDLKIDYIHLDNDTAGTLDKEDYERDWRQSYMTFTSVKLEKLTSALIYTLDTIDGEIKGTALVRSADHEVNPNYGIRYNGRTRSYTSYLSKTDSLDLDLQLQHLRKFRFLKSKISSGLDFERGNSSIETYDLLVERDPVSGKYFSFVNEGLAESYDVATIVGAPYIQLTATPLEKLGITFGGRYDWVSYDVEDNLFEIADDNREFSRYSPKAGLTYSFSSGLTFFANYSQGFVVPTVSQLFTGRGARRDLDPEKAHNYEIGARGVLWPGRLKFDVSLYNMQIQDKIITQTVDPVTSAIEYRNVGETSHTGVETTLHLLPWKWMALTLSYAYAKNVYEEFDDKLTGIDYSGNEMPLSPNHRLNSRLVLTPKNHLTLDFEMDLQNKYYVDDANSDTYARPPLFHARASYDFRNWLIWAHVLNLSDEKYATRVTAREGDFSYFPGNPRTFFVGIAYQWRKKDNHASKPKNQDPAYSDPH